MYDKDQRTAVPLCTRWHPEYPQQWGEVTSVDFRQDAPPGLSPGIQPQAAEQVHAGWTVAWVIAWLAAPVTTALFLLGRWAWRKWRRSPRVLNYHRDGFPADAVDIMSPGPWCNWRTGCTSDQAIAQHRADVLGSYGMKQAIKRELRGKDLVCCCAPKPCHGDIYLEIANADGRESNE